MQRALDRRIDLGIVVWPDCQIDKPKNQGKPEKDWVAAVAPVVPLSKLASELHSRVKAFRRAQWFPLPAKPPEISEDCYVDLRYIWPIRHALASDREKAMEVGCDGYLAKPCEPRAVVAEVQRFLGKNNGT